MSQKHRQTKDENQLNESQHKSIRSIESIIWMDRETSTSGFVCDEKRPCRRKKISSISPEEFIHGSIHRARNNKTLTAIPSIPIFGSDYYIRATLLGLLHQSILPCLWFLSIYTDNSIAFIPAIVPHSAPLALIVIASAAP